MTSPAKTFMDLIGAAGLGTISGTIPSGGWRLGVGKITDLPDQQIICNDSGGPSPNPAYLLDFSTVQVVIRGGQNAYVTAYEKGRAVRDALLGIDPVDINGDHVSGILVLSDLTLLNYDAKDRPQFSINFRTYIEPATNALTHRESL
jgi:hypothetical protein